MSTGGRMYPYAIEDLKRSLDEVFSSCLSHISKYDLAMGLAMALHDDDTAQWFDTLMDYVEDTANRAPDDDAFYQMCIDRLERVKQAFEELRADRAGQRARRQQAVDA
jgi:hypothetical protein